MHVYLLTLTAAVAGFLLPTRWGILGFVACVAALFLLQVSVQTARGYEGIAFEETLLLFNNSWASYIGYNFQITYRAFAAPMMVLALVFIFRLMRQRVP
ncbi:MAG: hypothetical protein AAF755_01880 [Pseudomonadota bacterium]